MSDIALQHAGETFSLPSLRASDLETEHAAEAIYNVLRIWNDAHALARWTLIGPILVFRTWINREFWTRWNHTRAINGRASLLLWMGMILFGWWTRPITRAIGRIAERTLERKLSMIPKDHGHALAITDQRLHHLSPIGIPLVLPVGGRDEVIEFVERNGEIHVQWGESSACLWIVFAEDGNFMTTENVSEVALRVTMRAGKIEVSAGPRSSSISFESFATILEELQLGGHDILCRNVTYTSLSTNAAQTVRFESIA